MTQKHTPGPWKAKTDMGDTRIVPVDGYGNTRGDGPICKIFDNPNFEANRALIESTPALLAERDRLLVVTKELREINSFLRQDKRELVKILKSAEGLLEGLQAGDIYPLGGVYYDINEAIVKAEKEEEK